MSRDNKYSVITKNISKGYKLYSSPKEKLLDLILPNGSGKTFYALKNISFQVEKGDVVGIIGLNGSGKSTLSNIIGGISMPTKGSIKINGEASLIAIGLGLNNFLTGIENIELKSIMMGYKKSEIEVIKQDIIDFADIGEFINQPLRTYSSGMRSRLGFAISVYTNPDILVIDEALSVGDPTFTEKCLNKMNEFKEKGKTIFFVSHSLGQIKKFCNKVLWLEYGRLKEYGEATELLPKYEEYIHCINKMNDEEKEMYKKVVLEECDHSLLEQFKITDPSLKVVESEGNLLKTVKLINKKKNTKRVYYSFDFSTALLGCLPSIYRKEGKSALILLTIQLVNAFLVALPYSLITNFIFTIIASFLTGKIYVDNLIDSGKYIPYKIWAKSHRST